MENDLRKWIRLIETQSNDEWDDDDEETKYDGLPPSSAIKSHLGTIAAAAQTVYDAWDQSDPDNDELNGGGVCHLIADKIADILGSAGMRVITQSATFEQHVYCIGQFRDGVFEIDIPHRYYERGGGFTWYKLPNVIFTPAFVHVERLDSNPARISQYVDEWDDDY